MPNNDLTVVISQGQSRSPEKRDLEQAVADAAASLPGVRVLKVPHLYDLAKDSETYKTLRSLDGDLVVLSWLFDRATHWTLDRHGVRGQPGEVLLKQEQDEEEEEESVADELERVIDSQPRDNRTIYCIDFRASQNAGDFAEEFARILAERNAKWLGGTTSESQRARFEQPTNNTFVGSTASSNESSVAQLFGTGAVATIEEHPGRRWYPVIDFSRCTNCMECIDFCLFGVYGVDSIETIVVEQPDNCRKGCQRAAAFVPKMRSFSRSTKHRLSLGLRSIRAV